LTIEDRDVSQEYRDNQADRKAASEGGETPRLRRRQMLGRAALSAGAIAGTAALAAWLHSDQSAPQAPAGEELFLGDYSIPSAGRQLARVRGNDRVRMVHQAIAAVGRIGTYIRKGDRVVLKVNAGFATPPALGATAHPDVVAAVVRLCLAAEAASVVVTDHPISSPQACFDVNGIAAAARQAGASVVYSRDELFRPVSVRGGRLIRRWPVLYEPLKDANKVIGIAPVKHHERSGATMAIKNWYGLLGGRRNTFHQDIHNALAELALLLKPTLVILDGTTAMMTNGPTGGSLSDLKAAETMIVSTDQVAADACAAELLDLRASDLPYLMKAQRAGAGTIDWKSISK